MTQVYNIYNNSVETCSGLAPYPISTYLATGGILDKTPVLCGGVVSNHTGVSSKCYYHDRDSNSWILIGNMNTVRFDAASIVTDSKLWVMGGTYNARYPSLLDTTEFIDMKNGGEITSGPPLTKGCYL